jgi:alpha-glucosidase
LLLASAVLIVVLTSRAIAQRSYTVRSPDGETELVVRVGQGITYSVSHRGKPLIETSPISLTLESARVLGRAARVRGVDTRQVNDSIRPVVPTKNAVIRDRYASMRLDFRDGFALETRAYDNGVAYRWVTSLADTITVAAEEATFHLAGDAQAIAGLDSSFMTHYEPAYRRLRVDSLRAPKLGLLPLLINVDGQNSGPKIAITESSLEDYPGMYLQSSGGNTLSGIFPAAARAEQLKGDRDLLVTDRWPWLARTVGRRSFPWRIVMIADRDRDLLENTLVYQLAPAQRLTDVSWIQPGKVSWDWWNALNVRDVPFRAGVNTETYKYYIDFASQYHIPYIILDEGWYKLGNLLEVTPGVDVPEIVRYGQSKGVGVVLWAIWKTLDDQMTPALDQFQRWGVRGVKIDFMQRDDQSVVNFYWRAAREAAARHLTLDFHGAHKPAGLNRAYPNVLTFEGVRGLEHDKWSTSETPEHDVTLPFTRMLAGPMDYTPGAMINAQPRDFRPIFDRPMSQGTRAHQLAMYVVYESPLQMLADSPSEYRRESAAMDFLSSVPVVWDETRALDGAVGEYVLVARRRGGEWYVGAMNNGSARTLSLDLSFLPDGAWDLDEWADGPNADRNGMDFTRASRHVSRTEKIELRMAPGGGFVGRLRRAQ